jgi:four helix bundle protein
MGEGRELNEPIIGGDVNQLAVWQKAKEFASALDEMCVQFHFGPDKEWLVFLVQQASGIVTNSIEEGWRRTNVAEILLSMYDAEGSLSMLAYYVEFLAGEGYLAHERAGLLEEMQRELGELLAQLIGVLRQELQLQTRRIVN